MNKHLLLGVLLGSALTSVAVVAGDAASELKKDALSAAWPGMLDTFPEDPDSGGPYVMWKGTPYEHLMVPIGARD